MCGLFPSIHIFFVSDVFFFKQKTAYEMRISDWSSDVCSSDLTAARRPGLQQRFLHQVVRDVAIARQGPAEGAEMGNDRSQFPLEIRVGQRFAFNILAHAVAHGNNPFTGCRPRCMNGSRQSRAEEHTSDLQSLMPNSYAVFCLQKPKHTNTTYL